MSLLNLFRRKNTAVGGYTPIFSPGAWRVLEPFAGAWQRNITWEKETVLANFAVFACTTLIASDISKLNIRYVRENKGIWRAVPQNKYEALIERPNPYQNRIQFFEHWTTSKLTRGNAYILKTKDASGEVTRMDVLHPDLVMPMVTPSGDVYYQLSVDNLAGIEDTTVTVPASDIIHDRFNCLFHPLVGLPPIFASGLAAYQAIKAQENSAKFFKNASMPSGIILVPGALDDKDALTLKARWEAGYGADNAGKTAVLADDMKYQALGLTAEQSQMVEQLRLTAEIVCSTYHVPKYKVIGDAPSYNNIEALEQQYYSQCLQKLIEDIELCLDHGLGATSGQGFEFDLDGLLRMDSTALYKSNSEAIVGGWMKPDEARKRVNLEPVEGGNTPYLQQQNYSLAALAKRDAQEDPFASKTTPPPAVPEPVEEEEEEEEDEDQQAQKFMQAFVEKMASLAA